MELSRWTSRASANATEGDLARMSCERLHAAQNRGDYVLVPDCRIDHQVIEAARRPFVIEVVFDVGHPLLVHVLHQVFCLFPAPARRYQAANFFVVRSIGEDAKSILAFAQQKRGTTAHDDRIDRKSVVSGKSVYPG